MYCYDNALPAAVALSLGLYFGERNTGIFHNHFIEFSSRPQLIEIKGKTFAERLEYLCTFNEVADTNVEAVFDLILDAAVRNNVPQEELPETLYLISDMEFNACVRNASVLILPVQSADLRSMGTDYLRLSSGMLRAGTAISP